MSGIDRIQPVAPGEWPRITRRREDEQPHRHDSPEEDQADREPEEQDAEGHEHVDIRV